MISKSLSLGVIIPKISSINKTVTGKVIKNTAVNRRAVLMARPTAKAAAPALSVGGAVPFVSALCLLGIIALVGFHLFIVNAYSSKGFELKRHQAAIVELTEQQKALLIKQADLGSIGKVNDSAELSGLIPITDEEYLSGNQLSQK